MKETEARIKRLEEYIRTDRELYQAPDGTIYEICGDNERYIILYRPEDIEPEPDEKRGNNGYTLEWVDSREVDWEAEIARIRTFTPVSRAVGRHKDEY